MSATRDYIPAEDRDARYDPDAAPDWSRRRTDRYRGKEPRGDKARSLIREVVDVAIIVALAFGIAYVVRTFVMQPFEIPSSSMVDTIQVGDRVFSERLSYYSGSPRQGDIITFTNPGDPSQTLIKRVVATEGQTVDLVDGVVYVDGTRLDEPYTEGKPSEPLDQQLDGVEIAYPYTVPMGHVWVMGDNRTNSADSRYFGAVDVSTISGRAFFTYWPLSHIGKLE